MNDQAPLPRFRKPPVSEVAVGVQFPAVLNPVHLWLYHERVKAHFPKLQVQAPIAPSFETFGAVPVMTFGIHVQTGPQLRLWFLSEDESSLIQLQSDRLLFNWRAGLKSNPYPHFEAVYSEFTRAFEQLEALAAEQHIRAIDVNQCEVHYVNPLPIENTATPLSAPEKVFRFVGNSLGSEWKEPLEDLAFTLRYRLKDQSGQAFGRLTVAVSSSGLVPNVAPGLQLELTARGAPRGSGREGVVAFHDQGHQAIVRCFAAITTTEMHNLWERYL